MHFLGNKTFGTLSSAPDKQIIKKIYGFVETVLENFHGKNYDNENYLTDELCKQLGFYKPPEFPFFFQHQNIEDAKKNTSTDFAAFGTYAYAQTTNKKGEKFPLVKFEAKRLNSNLPKTRSKEYVLGEYLKGKQTKNSGGIERFKNLRHGVGVKHGCIIGYIQSHNSQHWEEKISSWITQEINSPKDPALTWDENDYLKMNRSDYKINCYSSTPKRIDQTQIDMYHIWVLLN